MDYPVRDPQDWNALGKMSLKKRLRLFLRNRRYHKRAKSSEGVSLDRIHTATLPVDGADVIVICVARNAEKYIPSFLDHYRTLGVRRFAFVDDRSEDRTRELLRQPDVDIYGSNVGFRHTGGGLLWRDMLVDIYGRDRWYISIDSDEYLVYPGCEERPIGGFIEDLERHGLKRSLAVMLDIYPEGPLADCPPHEPANIPPTTVCPLHDGSGYSVFDDSHSTSVRGGPRLRLFNVDMRMSKFPVIFADRKTRFNGGSHHAPIPVERNFGPVVAVLLHYKFPADAVKDFNRIIDQADHANGSDFYRRIVSHSGFSSGMSLEYESSRRYADSETLLAQGYMKDLRLEW